MALDVYADLIHAFRSALEQESGLAVNPLRPPVDDEVLEQAEEEAGIELPGSLKDLLRVANGVHCFSGFEVGLGGPSSLVETTRLVRDFVDRIDSGEYELPEGWWYGTPPLADFFVFGRYDKTDVVIEVGGPLHGRILILKGAGGPNLPNCWREIGADIETVLRWSLELAESNNRLGRPFDVGRTTYNRHPSTYLGFRPDTGEPWDQLDEVRDILADYDITPAVFGHYEPPPGYNHPAY